jgi:hypothetical protein
MEYVGRILGRSCVQNIRMGTGGQKRVLTREENLARKRVLEQTACLGGTISKSVNSESAQGEELYTQDDGFHLDGQLCVLYALNFIGTALDFYKCDV